VNDGNPSRAIINIDDVSEPSAKVTITQWDLEERNAFPNADGQITSWKCRLAAPVTIPMLATGVLNLDYRKRSYSMFVALSGVEDAPLRCVHSRTGPDRGKVHACPEGRNEGAVSAAGPRVGTRAEEVGLLAAPCHLGFIKGPWFCAGEQQTAAAAACGRRVKVATRPEPAAGGALHRVTPVAGHPMAGSLDATQPLGVDVRPIARAACS
jgi:hypothetical protein